MKKLLFLLLAAAAVTACDNDEERNGKQSAVYDGTLIVTDNTKTPPETATSENVRYELAESNDGTITLTMPGIKFVSNMPALTIVIPKLEFVNETGGVVSELKSTVTPIVPYIGSTPYPEYRITDFYGEMTPETLSIRFNCSADIGDGDHTSLSCIPAGEHGRMRLLCKQEGIIAGIEIARIVFDRLDPDMHFEQVLHDGDRVKPGDVAFYVSGRLRSLLQAERIILNIMQRMSGVATQTAVYVARLEGLHTKVLDTRKTTPGMRVLDKMAVKIGGGENHRMGLFDMILLKDNHIDFAGGIRKAICGAREYLKAKGKDIPIECEVRSLEDIDEVFAAGGADRIMFDNFTPAMTREAVKKVAGRCETESSGGITLDTMRDYAECGVDFISVGALTHQIKSLDMSLKACE